MTDNLPPLPELPPPEVEEWSETFITLRGEGWKKETVEKYATDYARAAIERQSVPALTDNDLEGLFQRSGGKWTGDFWRIEDADFHPAMRALISAAAPQPQPVQEPYAWHYTNNGGVSVWHIDPSSRLAADIKAAREFPKVHRIVALYTSPQAQPLTVEQIWENDAIMALNADAGLSLTMLEKIVRIVEASHGITKGTA